MADQAEIETLFERWCNKNSSAHNGHPIEVLTEKPNVRIEILPDIVNVLRDNYDARSHFLRRAKRLGYDRAVEAIRLRLPTTATARSGDMGEILAAEYIKTSLPFIVPINRLQWKDGRNMPLRGDDIIGFRLDERGKLDALLKGESKSRIGLGGDALIDATQKLCEYDGRPSPHTLLYLVTRLFELGQPVLAEVLEDYALAGGSVPITHMIFTFSGNSPDSVFATALSGTYLPGILRRVAGLVVVDHQDFIDAVFELASA